MAEILDKNNKAFAGQKLVYSSKGYSQLLSEYGTDITSSTGALYNSIIFSVDGYILTHGMVLKGAVVDTDGGGKDGNVSIKLADDKKSFTLTDADGNKTNIAFPTIAGDDNVVVSYSDGKYSVSLSTDLLGRITTLEEGVETINEEIDAIEKEIDGIDESIEEIEGNVTSVTEKVSTLETTVGDENSGLVKGLNDVKSNISDIEGDIESIETSISNISGENGKIADLQSQITANKTAVETSQSAAEAAQETADQNASDIEALEGRVETLEGVVGDATSGLVKDVAANTAAIEVNAKAISANTGEITTIKGNISTINSNVESLDGRLTAAETNITNITKDVGSIDVKVTAGVTEAKSYTDSEVSDLKDKLEATIKDSVKAAEAMRFKGTVASQTELDALTDNTNGDTYKITGDFGSYEVGDMIIWRSTENGGEWVAVQANIDGAVTTSSDLGTNQIVVGNDTHSVKTISTGAGISIGSDISVKAGSGISVDANGVSVKASTGLEVTDAGVAVKLGATSNAANGVHAVTADANGNLQVEGVYNTWREIKIDGESTNASPLEFSATFTMNDSNQVDLAWFEL
jgi:predicted  nucleic acid-binding Zn-ribbon protein